LPRQALRAAIMTEEGDVRGGGMGGTGMCDVTAASAHQPEPCRCRKDPEIHLKDSILIGWARDAKFATNPASLDWLPLEPSRRPLEWLAVKTNILFPT